MASSTQSDLLIGLDLGTSAIKAILVDVNGTIRSQTSKKVTLIRPAPDQCEIDPLRYADTISGIIAGFAASADGPIRGIATCTASGNTVLLDAEKAPIGNTISWLDNRTRGKERDLWPEIDGERFYHRAGWPWRGMFPLAHLAWLRDNQPDLWSQAHFLSMNETYVGSTLCGEFAVDPSKATTFYLYDQMARTWNEELLQFLGTDASKLPRIVPSGTAIGTVPGGQDTRYVAGCFDHPSAARSSGVLTPGEALISAGTSWVAFVPVESRDTALEVGALVDPFTTTESSSPCWGAMLSLTAVAAKIDGFLETLFPETDARYVAFDREAMKSPAGSNGAMINPWEQNPDEALVTLSEYHTSDITRALMEGCAYLMKDRLSRFSPATGREIERLVMVGGPTRSPIWPSILATVLERPIAMPESGENTGALGAAMLAGVGSGIFGNLNEAREAMKSDERIIEPVSAEVSVYQDGYGQFRDRFGMDAR